MHIEHHLRSLNLRPLPMTLRLGTALSLSFDALFSIHALPGACQALPASECRPGNCGLRSFPR